MEQSTFETADPLVDEIAELVDQALISDGFADLRQSLAKLSKALGARYSVGITALLEVFDHQQERNLPLLNTGLSTTDGGEPFRTWGDSSPQRYIVDGQIQVVPHDRCPKCWNDWDFKTNNRSCPHCDTTLGGNCKILLDTDTCPHCENGKMSMSHPKCEQCGFEVDPSLVVWG